MARAKSQVGKKYTISTLGFERWEHWALSHALASLGRPKYPRKRVPMNRSSDKGDMLLLRCSWHLHEQTREHCQHVRLQVGWMDELMVLRIGEVPISLDPEVIGDSNERAVCASRTASLSLRFTCTWRCAPGSRPRDCCTGLSCCGTFWSQVSLISALLVCTSVTICPTSWISSTGSTLLWSVAVSICCIEVCGFVVLVCRYCSSCLTRGTEDLWIGNVSIVYYPPVLHLENADWCWVQITPKCRVHRLLVHFVMILSQMDWTCWAMHCGIGAKSSGLTQPLRLFWGVKVRSSPLEWTVAVWSASAILILVSKMIELLRGKHLSQLPRKSRWSIV